MTSTPHAVLQLAQTDEGLLLVVGERRWRLDATVELALSDVGLGAAVGEGPLCVEVRPRGATHGQTMLARLDDGELEALETLLRRAAGLSGCGFVDLETARRLRDEATQRRAEHFSALLQGLARSGADATSLAVLPHEFGNGCALRAANGELWFIEANGHGLSSLDAFFDTARVDVLDRLIRCTADTRATHLVEALGSRVRHVHSLADAPVERLLMTDHAHLFRLRTVDARVTFASRVKAEQWAQLTSPALKTDVLWTSHARGVHDVPPETMAALRPLMVVVSAIQEPMGEPADLVVAPLLGSGRSVHLAQTSGVGVAGGACGWRIIDG